MGEYFAALCKHPFIDNKFAYNFKSSNNLELGLSNYNNTDILGKFFLTCKIFFNQFFKNHKVMHELIFLIYHVATRTIEFQK